MEENTMFGYTLYSRWVVVLWAAALLFVGIASAATHTQTVTLKVQGMV